VCRYSASGDIVEIGVVVTSRNKLPGHYHMLLVRLPRETGVTRPSSSLYAWSRSQIVLVRKNFAFVLIIESSTL